MSNQLKIGGVFFDGPSSFTWPFLTGAFSPESTFILSDVASQNLSTVSNPVNLEANVFYRLNTTEELSNVFIENLYLRTPIPIGDHKQRWTLSDIRWVLEKRNVPELFGMTRQANEFKKLTPDARGDFNRAPLRHFIGATLKKSGKLEFGNQFTNGELLEHWTALEALKYMLSTWIKDHNIKINSVKINTELKIDDDVKDNKRPLVNFATNQPWPRVVRRLLSLAHVGLYVDETGAFVVFNLAPLDLPSHVGGFTGAGNPTKSDLRRDRPSNVRVLFRKDMELRCNFFEAFKEDANKQITETGFGAAKLKLNARTIENVCILPQDVTDANTGEIAQRGQIVTLEKALLLWKNDPDNPPPPLVSKAGSVGVDLNTIRKHVLTGSLATLWVTSLAKLNRKNDLWASRVKTVYSAYRRMFRIVPEFLDMIENIRNETGQIADNVTGKRPPAAVWMSHFRIPSSRIKTKEGFTKGANKLKPAFNVYPWGEAKQNVTDHRRLPLQGTEVSPMQISWVDKRQGLFKVDFLPDLYGDVFRYIRGTFPSDQSPFFQKGFLLGTDQRKLSQMSLDESFQLSVLFSVTLRTPNNDSKMEVIEIEKSKIPPNSEGPEADIIFGSMHAFRIWNDNSSEIDIDPKTGQLNINGNDLANKSIIEDLATAVFDDVKFRFQNLIIGIFRGIGHDSQIDRPFGSYQTAMEYNGGKGSMKTIYDSSSPPSPPPIWELLPPDTQRVLYRLEDNPNP